MNIPLISVTLLKLGLSVALPCRLVQPSNARSMVLHGVVPHCSILLIFRRLPAVIKKETTLYVPLTLTV